MMKSSQPQHEPSTLMRSEPCSLAYLLLTNENPDQWHAVISQQRQVIGRSKQSDIVVPTRFHHLSRRHAEIYIDRDGIKVRDLNSRCGTHVNGVWLEPDRDVEVVIGDRLWMGGVEFNVASEIPRFVGPVPDADASADGSFPAPGGTMPIPAQLLLAELTQAELAIVMWIGRGYIKDEEIAKKLYRSPNTVRTQMNSIFRKLNVRSRAEIIALLKGCD
jgi:DNA-binding CsgD family transcriptional regulator